MRKFKISEAVFVTNPGKWFIDAGGGSDYLHNDGVIRRTTQYEGKYLGWYPNRESARKAVRLYRTLNPSR